VILHNQNVR